MKDVLDSFELNGELKPLTGGSQQVYKVNDYVLKQVTKSSMEHSDSLSLINWMHSIQSKIKQDGFRFPLLKKDKNGNCIGLDNWTAWKFLDGKHADHSNIDQCIQAIDSYHKALEKIEYVSILEENESPWGVAHLACLNNKPKHIHPKLKSLIDQLYGLRKPLSNIKNQVIHADLNSENILISNSNSPAIIDLSPFWGPKDFALAIYANFIGPRSGDIEVLKKFEYIDQFDQLLIRANIRMLIVMSQINQLGDWEESCEKRAVLLVIDYIENQFKN